jgi:transposase
LDALKRRHLEAIRLMDTGLNLSQIARELHAVWQTVTSWVGQYRQGKAYLCKAGRVWRTTLLIAG